MARLSSDQVLKDNNAADPTSVTTLHLTHKALSDITCLANFVNLEKLDLKLNNLTSLEGLRSCVNLKWLSVVENKLESLEGIQGLTKLTVLNAGKNKLKSIDQVMSVVSLRALILNENEISSICKLDQLKDLNTLVLSKNPIRKIGEALMKVKSITKLSLSYCELQGIGTSLKSCVELSELRLAHNEIKSLPAELKLNSKLRSLDLGNNVITSWSELKVLELLTNLRNLNLQGNPAATVNKVMRKIKKALSKLQIFNARPVDKDTENKKGRKSSKKRKRTVDASKKEDRVVDEENKGHKKDKADRKKESLITNVDPGMENKSTKKKAKKDDKPLDKGFALEENVSKVEKKLKKQHKNDEQSELDVIDDAEASFAELFKINDAENLNLADEMKAQDKAPKDVMKLAGDPVTSFAKHKNAKIQNMESLSAPVAEIGMGGPSTWGDEL
ncbi:leucine-rich repeat-containing protein 9-like isoform X3 [Glycine soja]|uniref:Protein phosphatase 1 regulatory subunit SDS22-like isoform B n=1 Tax=Glycine soja TaxID=3848 RepID=A0A445ICL6_GLYSO|nr:leucine-rich repeat-containing protein 9-like isoform X3 [Glycine soja]RZB83780.1 Protein phosphatase 1 regulatory subunit SDS22-like isoform B [Glycine soja]